MAHRLKRLIAFPRMKGEATTLGFGAKVMGVAGLAILGTKPSIDDRIASAIEAGFPRGSDFALRTTHLLRLPINGKLLNAIAAFDFGLPGIVEARGANQVDGMLLTAVDQ